MTFRRKLLAVFAITIVLAVAAVAGLVSAMTRRAFDKADNDRTAALITQFQREFERQGADVVRRVDAAASSDGVTRMATMLNHASTDSA
jgi:aryl-alcohol dehydrogenase-like predicted oxidoreductase